MNKVIITTIIAITALVTSADAVTIIVSNPTSGESGLVNNFNDNDLLPEPFGFRESGGAGSVAGGVLTLVDNTDFIDYESSTDLASTTNAQVGGGGTEDWVMLFDIENTVFGSNGRIFESGGATGDGFTLRNDGSQHGYKLQGDDPGGSGYGDIGTFNSGPGSHTFAMHYDSSANNFNFYADNVLIVGGALPRDDSGGPHMWTQVRFGGSNSGATFLIDNMMVSAEFQFIIIPEPGTLSLMAMGLGLLFLRQRGMKV